MTNPASKEPSADGVVGEKFTYRVEDGWIEECECCSSPAPLAEFDSGMMDGKKKLICEICASTIIGRLTEYKSHRDDRDTLICMAQMGNLILDKLTGRPPAAPTGPLSEMSNADETEERK